MMRAVLMTILSGLATMWSTGCQRSSTQSHATLPLMATASSFRKRYAGGSALLLYCTCFALICLHVASQLPLWLYIIHHAVMPCGSVLCLALFMMLFPRPLPPPRSVCPVPRKAAALALIRTLD